MTPIRPCARLAAVAAVLAAAAAAPLAAQDCTLRYRFQAGAANPTLLPYQQITLNAGQSRTIEGNYLREALNEGGHDVRIVLGVGSVETEHALIDVAGQTAVLPPVAFAAQQLVRAECGHHATHADAAALIQALGSSASQVVQQATQAARSGAQQARAEALALLDTLDAAGAWADLRDLPSTLAAEWEEVRQAYPPTRGRFDLATDAPELADALAESRKGGVAVGGLLRGAEDRLDALAADLSAFERAWRSPAPSGSVADDLAGSFPDLADVLAVSCSVDLPAVQGPGPRLANLVAALAAVDERFDAASTLTDAVAVPAAYGAAMEAAARQGWCDDADEVLGATLEEDAAAFVAWADALHTTAERLRGGPLRPADWQAIRDGRRAVVTTRAAAEVATVERQRHERAYRLARARARRDGTITHSERRVLIRAYRRHAELRAEERARRRAHVHARARYGQTTQAIRLERATPAEVSAFRDATRSFPASRLDDAALDAALACAEDLRDRWAEAERALDDAIAEAEALAARVVPDDVKAGLVATLAAAADLAAALAATEAPVAGLDLPWNELRRDMASLSPELRFPDVSPTPAPPFGPVPVPYPVVGPLTPEAAATFQAALPQAVATAHESARGFRGAVGAARTEWAAAVRAADAFGREADALAGAVRAHADAVATDVARVVAAVADARGAHASGQAALDDMDACANSVVDGLTTTLNGIDATLEAVLADLLAQVPADVLEAVDDVQAAVAAAVDDLADLRTAEADAAQLLVELEDAVGGLDTSDPQAFVEHLAAPVRWQTIADFPGEAAARATRLEQRLEAVRAHGADVAASLVVLGERAAAAGGEVAADARRLVFTELEEKAAGAAMDDLERLAGAWAAVAAALPERVAERILPLAVAALLEEAEAVRAERMAELASAVARAGDHLGQASEAVRQVGGASAVEEAASSAVSGLQGRASTVLSDLQDLLDPTAFALGTASATLAAAAQLSDDVASMGEAAAQAFGEVTSAARQTAVDGLAAFEEERTAAATLVQTIQASKLDIEEAILAMTEAAIAGP